MNTENYLNAPIFNQNLKIMHNGPFKRKKIKKNYHFLKNYHSHLFAEAYQNFKLIESDIDYSYLSCKIREAQMTKLSANVAFIQKEIDFNNLTKQSEEALDIAKKHYDEKVEKCKDELDRDIQIYVNTLNDIHNNTEEEENKAKKLVNKELSLYRENAEKRAKQVNDEINHKLKEAQNEYIKLQKLRDDAAIAEKKIANYKQNQDYGKNKRPLQISPRIADAMAHKPKQKAYRQTFYPNLRL